MDEYDHCSFIYPGTEPKPLKARNRRRKLNENNDNQKELPELTTDLWELITKRQDVAGFCGFGAVCKSWLEIYDRSSEDFLESQAPIVVLISSSQDKRECYLHDIANGKTKKVMLPNIVSKFFVGCSAGFLILEDIYREIFLINPFTGHQLKCHAPHFSLIGKSLHDNIIVASTSSPKSYVILAISNTMRELQVFHFKNSRWFTWLFLRQEWVDIAIFKGHVYVVKKNAELGELRIKTTDSTSVVFNWLRVRNTPNVNNFYLKLVVSNDQLLMVDFVPEEHLNIYKMDFEAMEWVKVDELGDQAFFFGRAWGSAMRKPGRWGGQSNCVYCFDTLSNMCCIYSMEAQLISKFPFVEDSITSELSPIGWYYPHQCIKVDYLNED
ncbi:uncharacterized protein LOC133298180 [Gastrolobium bilobum]|uniref:uncharacterized protein LOC133298180 n=1 Tax=Gastrolobium bilobum TaxID=150636 RepID=UPI002AB14C69|nr:uncharacterized protein LOC133298180 [Gastrolobium bilobum]